MTTSDDELTFTVRELVCLEDKDKAERLVSQAIARARKQGRADGEAETKHKWIQDYEGVPEIVEWIDSCVKLPNNELFQGQKNVLTAMINTLIEREVKKLQTTATPADANKVTRFDEAEFNKLTAKGRKAWADVPDATAWVEEQRGNDGST